MREKGRGGELGTAWQRLRIHMVRQVGRAKSSPRRTVQAVREPRIGTANVRPSQNTYVLLCQGSLCLSPLSFAIRVTAHSSRRLGLASALRYQSTASCRRTKVNSPTERRSTGYKSS